jgi:type IV pilus assembly protein PilA
MTRGRLTPQWAWILGAFAAFFLLVPAMCWVTGWPGQGRNYTGKSQVSEGAAMVDGLRKNVIEFHAAHGTLPASNSDIGLPAPSRVTGKYISQLEVLANGTLEVTYSMRPPQAADPSLDGATMRFTPVEAADGSFTWICASDTLPQKFCPSACACTGR